MEKEIKRDGELVLTSSEFDKMTEDEKKKWLEELLAKKNEILKQLENGTPEESVENGVKPTLK